MRRRRRSGGEVPAKAVETVTSAAHSHSHSHSHDDGHDHQGSAHGHGRRKGLMERVVRVLVPHSHNSVESVDNALRDSDEGMRSLKVSSTVLVATAIVELSIVWLSGSIALFGDSVHNFADALTAVPLGLAFWLQGKSPTKRYTYGYGRAEDLAGVFIVLVIAASSVVAGWGAVSGLIHPRPVDHVGWVIVAGLVGFAGNELVALYRVRTGSKIGSAALVADGRHARTDGMTSLAVVAGAVGVAAGWPLADPIVGLVITVLILGVLMNVVRDIYRRLMDSVDPDLVDQVAQVLAGVPGIERVEDVRIRWIGHELRAEARVVSPGDLSLSEAHAIGEEGHHRLLHDVPWLAEAILHTDPLEPAGHDPHQEVANHFRAEATC
jgi:cation diffusion facilitator family transporter